MKHKLSGNKAKVALKNMYSLSRYDFHKDDLELRKAYLNVCEELEVMRMDYYRLVEQMDVMRIQLKKEEVLRYYVAHPELRTGYEMELAFLENTDELGFFPYEKLKLLNNVDSGFDKSCKMPFVCHNGKKLYFPLQWDENKAKTVYRNYIEDENLLGGGYRRKAPHRYQLDNFKVEDGDILVDVGCAEALFSLDVIEKAAKVYLIESDPEWLPALKKTFEPYGDKVLIFNKLVSDRDSDFTITLDRVLSNLQNETIFLKMDIEGAETTVLASSSNVLSSGKFKVACCTYHNQGDEAAIRSFFEGIHYQVSTSDGYMLFYQDKLKPPFFRRGMIRAWNI